MKVQITGTLFLDPDEVDEDSATGMTEEAYLNSIMNENGTGLRIADLNDLDVTVVKR